jgi:hypothetical protein
MSSLASRLSETSQIWRRALAPFAEGIARSLSSMTSKASRGDGPATRLTQSRKREAKGLFVQVSPKSRSKLPATCRICGTALKSGLKYCRACVPAISRENVRKAAKLGRMATHKPEAQARRAETQRRQNAALKAWNSADKPNWLDETVFKEEIQPLLLSFTVPTIMAVLAVSEPYALRIRGGQCVPHPRHWLALARLAKVSANSVEFSTRTV